MKIRLLYLFVFSLVACSKPEENSIRIPSEFFVSIRERINSSTDRDLFLDLSSMLSKYCSQDSLVYKLLPNGNTINITVFDSYKTNGCLNQLDPLDGQILLPKFADSLYLNIRLGSASETKAFITQTSKSYILNIQEGSLLP